MCPPTSPPHYTQPNRPGCVVDDPFDRYVNDRPCYSPRPPHLYDDQRPSASVTADKAAKGMFQEAIALAAKADAKKAAELKAKWEREFGALEQRGRVVCGSVLEDSNEEGRWDTGMTLDDQCC
jgi:hypothetical protein